MAGYKFISQASFIEDRKHLLKRNQNIQKDIDIFEQEFDDRLGKTISGTSGAKKIRMRKHGSGKSGGYRVIYYLKQGKVVYLLRLYDKTEQENLSDGEKKQLSKLVSTLKKLNRKIIPLPNAQVLNPNLRLEAR